MNPDEEMLMKKLLLLTAMMVLSAGAAFGLTFSQAQANAMTCVELIKFSAELSSPSMNDFMLKSTKVVFDKNGYIYVVDKSLGDLRFKYLDKNKKVISGKNLSEAYNNAYKNAVYVEIELTNKLLYSSKLTLTYGTPAKKNQNFSIDGVLMVKSGKDEVTYKINEKVTVKEITPTTTVLASGIVKSDGNFKDMVVIDFSKNVFNSTVDNAKPIDAFNSQKRSQKIGNLKLLLTR